MFENKQKNNQNNQVQQEEIEEVYKLKLENEKLKMQVGTLEFKLGQEAEKYGILQRQIEDMQKQDAQKLLEENKKLSDELKKLRFDLENDTRNIIMSTENVKLKSQVEIKNAEIQYLKELLDTYRAMPDVKAMIDNISSLAVPNITELKEFAKIIADTNVTDISSMLSKNTEMIQDIKECIRYGGVRSIYR